MAPARSTRRSRKRRRAPGNGRSVGASGGPRTVTPPRRERSAERRIQAERDERRQQSTLGVYGERPESPFAGLPVSELLILVGAVGLLVGLISGGKAALLVGIGVCTLGVLEVSAREHFSGYRSHATLLAAIPAVAILAVSVAVLGAPRQRAARELLILAAVPVFGLAFWGLRKRFRTARQARIVRPPVP